MSQHRPMRGIFPCKEEGCEGLTNCECNKCDEHCERALGLCSLDNGLLLFSMKEKPDHFDTLINKSGL